MLKGEKERVVAELVERLRTSDTLIVADYRGLDMTAIDGVRSELLKHGARFSVVKNTLTKRAAEVAGVDALNEFLEGPSAIAFVGDGDMIAVAKTLNETARQTRILTLKGGVLEGRAITADDVRELANLPPADILRGQVLGAVVGPLNAIVGLFTAPLRDFVGVIDARIEHLRESGDTGEAPTAAAAKTEPATAEPAGVAAVEAEPPADAQPKSERATEETPEEG